MLNVSYTRSGSAPTSTERSISMRTLNVILNGARGGQGTSTIAAALALYAAGHVRTQLVAIDPRATAALLGVAQPTEGESSVTEQLTLTAEPVGDPEIRIIDAGTIAFTGDGDVHLVVLRGPCYVALRSVGLASGRRPDGVIVLAEAGRSLDDRDVRDVTGIDVVATVAVTPAVARTIDAGLLVARLHGLSDLAPLRRYATTLLRAFSLDHRASPLPALAPPRSADLNESSVRTPVKIGTDLPVPLSGTGRGHQSRRAGRSQRAYRSRANNGRRDRAEHREAEQRCCGVLRRRSRHLGRGLLHRSRRGHRALGRIGRARTRSERQR